MGERAGGGEGEGCGPPRQGGLREELETEGAELGGGARKWGRGGRGRGFPLGRALGRKDRCGTSWTRGKGLGGGGLGVGRGPHLDGLRWRLFRTLFLYTLCDS